MFSKTQKNSKKRVSMIPLIDIVFLLLIFFMLSTDLVKQRIVNIIVPSQNAEKTNSWQGAIIIRPNKDYVLINNKKLSNEKAQKLLNKLIINQQQKVIIKPYKNVNLQKIVDIVDLIENLGTNNISLIK